MPIFFVLLLRFYSFLDSDDENDEEEEEEDDDLSSRLAGVSLDDADAVWQRLSSSERAEFEKLLQTGGITELLPEFSPWWEKYVEFYSPCMGPKNLKCVSNYVLY